jgi:hypothetical protein
MLLLWGSISLIAIAIKLMLSNVFDSWLVISWKIQCYATEIITWASMQRAMQLDRKMRISWNLSAFLIRCEAVTTLSIIGIEIHLVNSSQSRLLAF